VKNAKTQGSILLVEDTSSLQLIYRSILVGAGYDVIVAGTAQDALRRLHEKPSQTVLLDLVLPDRDGLDLMREMIASQPDLNVVVMTAHGSVNKAVEAMRAGALEFIVKPFDETRLLAVVANAVNGAKPISAAHKTPADQIRPLPNTSTPTILTRIDGGFIGSSQAMDLVHSKIASVARSMATVFITGESGTGKELCALAVHGNSPRANGPFIALNCGAIPEDLLESEVFGHIKGSFTGAISDKPGAAAAADGGTLFLDEVCEMAPALQTKLLRFLQTSTVVPVGATRPRKVNVRIVCATNRDPMDAVRRGLFREDLFYRLFVVPIHMPPLRERTEDVIEIAETALLRFAEEEGKEFSGLASSVRRLFLRLPWPGNVRQVLNVIRNVVVLNEGGAVTLDMLPSTLNQQDQITSPLSQDTVVQVPQGHDLDALIGKPLHEIERIVIEATLKKHSGSIPRTARVLELSPSTLYRKIEGWNAQR
jgi:two-component system repressor protein LuxO